MAVVGNMEVNRTCGSKKISFIGCLTLFCVFTTTTCNRHERNQEFLPWPLKVQRRGANEVCETQECQKTAELIKQSLNLSVDPCDDFYEFACGSWDSSHPVLPTEPVRSQFGNVGDTVEAEVRELIESPIDPDDPGPVQAAKKFYIACKDTAHMEGEGLTLLLEILSELGGWPLATDNWNGENFDWQTAVGKIIKKIGSNVLITFYVYKDQKNSSRNVLINDQPRLSFPREVLVDDKGTYHSQLDAFRKFVIGLAAEIAEASNIVVSTPDIAAEVDEMMEFEKKLAEITVPSEQRRDPYRQYNPKTLQQMQSLTDSVEVKNDYARINWNVILDNMFDGLGFTFPPDEVVIVNEVDFLPKLVKLIDETPLRVIGNYVIFAAVKNMIGETTSKMRQLEFEFSSVMTGQTESSPRWQQCIDATTGFFGMAVGYSYVKKFFDNETKKSARLMVEAIRSQFSSSIDEIEWMDESTKEVAKEKANEMMENVGYPNWFSNSTALDEYYKGVSIGESHFSNALSVTEVLNAYWLNKLRKPAERSEWLTSPATVNAFYNPQGNSILLPAGILKFPMFATRRPKALNFGGMGAIIGHEITHGFDDSGRKSDKYGNLAQWWSQGTIDTYEKKTQCFLDQYSNYRVPQLDSILHTEVKMSGLRTLGENIADNGGLRQSYLAYKKYVKKHGADKRLAGLEEYSPEKLFFLSFATAWCTSSTLQAQLRQILTDSHSAGRFRVIGTLSNMDQFSEVWECPPGSRMNPPKKCMIW